MQNLRIRLIKALVDINEKLFFERKLYAFYKTEFQNNVGLVIDVGANKGQSIDFFLRINRNCEIHALEPNPSLFTKLERKYRNKPNVHLYNLGISNVSGDKLFFENVLDYTSSFEDLNFDSDYLNKKARILGVKTNEIIKDKYEVQVLTLIDFIRKFNLPGVIDVIKIDTEGHEYYCLLGLFGEKNKSEIRYIQIENHTDDMYKNRVPYEKIKHLLNTNNYLEKKVLLHGYSKLEEVIFKLK